MVCFLASLWNSSPRIPFDGGDLQSTGYLSETLAVGLAGWLLCVGGSRLKDKRHA